MAALKKGTSVVDNIPADFIQTGGETTFDVLTEICDKNSRLVYPINSVADY